MSPRYTCPRCQEVYEGEIHACHLDDADSARLAAPAVTAALGRSEPATPNGTTDVGTTPTLPGTPTAKAVTVRTDLLVDQTLAGRYKILRKLGEGGMGAVYEAQHVLIGKRVAVKVLLDKYAQKRDVVMRLQQEARLASSIGHQSIVDVNDFGETADGRSFVVMEFLEGESLAQLIQKQAPLPPERVLLIIRQAADALGAAHKKGIIHRDVKPENIFILPRDGSEFVKVLDFGISKAMKKPGEEDEAASPRLTQTGMVLGTPLYMSPEQARGESEVDERIDVYALGVILYEALSGETPYRGTNYLGIINQVLTQEPTPLRQLRPDLALSEALERVVMKMMHKDRARRYAAMSEVVADIDRILSGDQNVGLPVVLPEDSTGRAGSDDRLLRRSFLAGAAALVAVVGGITVLVSARRDRDTEPAAAVAPIAPSVDAAPAPPPRPAPVSVAVRANVQCIVYKGDKVLARSGDSLPLPPGEPVTLTCRAEGYQDAPRTFVPVEGQPLFFQLERPKVRRSGGRAAAEGRTSESHGAEPARETLPNPYHHHP